MQVYKELSFICYRLERYPSLYSPAMCFRKTIKPFGYRCFTFCAVKSYSVPIVLVKQIEITATVAFGEYLHMIATVFEYLDNFPCWCAIISVRVRVASETKVNEFPCDSLALDLLSRFFNDVRSRFYARVKFFFISAQYIRREAIKTFVRTPSVNIYSIIAIFFCFAFWLIYRFHVLLLSARDFSTLFETMSLSLFQR